MTDRATGVLAWSLLAVCLGFLIGKRWGDRNRHRKCLERENEELRNRLKNAAAHCKPIHCALKQQRNVTNDIHRRLLAVSKGLEKLTS